MQRQGWSAILLRALALQSHWRPVATGASLASPKSRIFAWPRLVTKIFAGLMSRCTMPRQWAASSASAIWIPNSSACSDGQWSPVDEMLQRFTVQKLHSDKSLTFVFANLVNGADIRMVQRRSSLRLALEAFEGLMVAGYIVRQELESNETIEACVFGLINHTHAAATEFSITR